jgi:hypothetical protein
MVKEGGIKWEGARLAERLLARLARLSTRLRKFRQSRTSASAQIQF